MKQASLSGKRSQTVRRDTPACSGDVGHRRGLVARLGYHLGSGAENTVALALAANLPFPAGDSAAVRHRARNCFGRYRGELWEEVTQCGDVIHQ